MNEQHPSRARLEAYFVGESNNEDKKELAEHLGRCEQCQAYLNTLAQERRDFLKTESAQVFLSRPRLKKTLEDKSIAGWWALTRRSIVHRFVFGGAGVAALAGVIVFVSLRDATDATVGGEIQGLEVRSKGHSSFRLVIQRRRQPIGITLHREQVTIRAGDQLQLELHTNQSRVLSAGLLTDDGSWVELAFHQKFSPGRSRVGYEALEVDSAPSGGWFIVGAPDAVEQVRRTQELNPQISVCRIEPE